MSDYQESCRKSAANWLIFRVREWDKLNEDQRNSDGGALLRAQIEAAGQAASFFGGYDGMKKLHDACEQQVGNDNSIGYHLNYLWDMIGGWMR